MVGDGFVGGGNGQGAPVTIRGERGAIGWLLLGVLLGIALVIYFVLSLIF